MAGRIRNPYECPQVGWAMAAAPDKLDVKRASDSKEAQDKQAFFRELAKATKPTGPSSRDEEDKSQ